MTTRPSPSPLTEAERVAAEALALWHNAHSSTSRLAVAAFEGEARAVVAAVYDLIATEARYAAADGLLALAPEQATPDAKDAFWRAAAITQSNPLSLPASKETPR